MTFSPIPIERRKSFTDKQRAAVFSDHGGVCAICKGKIQVGQTWDVDHTIALAMGGSNDTSNLRPVHVKCHRGEGSKTSDDVKAIARADRLAKKHFGIKTPKRKWPSRPLGR